MRLVFSLKPLPPNQPLPDPAKPTNVPSEVPPTKEPTAVINTEAPVPTATIPQPTTTLAGQNEAVEVGSDFWLTFDPQFWEKVKTNGYDYLVSKTMSTCKIQYQFGHGINSQRFQPEIDQKQFGNMTFETKRWYPVDNPSETILYGYYSGDIYISIEDSVASPIADECIAQVDDVLRLSVDKSFKKD